jgi:TolB-like protein/predicted Ser/Thr protein kinase/Tfp pilus assembly protein PilF
MQINNWQRVETLFHEALRLEGDERATYLARECAGDEPLRREVESLVASHESGPSFIEQPALSLGMRVLWEGPAGSLAGRSIGHYKVVRLLGRGGMGEVYLAEDSVLERHVALKFITNDFVGDEWAREQLMKEARAVARLENSNICAVYGVEETESHNFIVMQYVEGETLSTLLRGEPPAPARALDLAEQIAAALSAAHARDIIHRDVKPQNIIVTAGGQVKVLDFGLAKFVRQKQEALGTGHAPQRATQVGLVVGTVAYMSPEQARGEELDCRSDIFSFGIVLHELLGGGNPFLRPTDKETISAITEDGVPPLTALAPELPAGLERVVRKCLAKDRALRYETSDELLRDLRGLRDGGRRDAAGGPWARLLPSRAHLGRYAAAALAFVVLLLAGAGFIYTKLLRIHTLAVLPITNLSQDSGADYLSEGMTHNLSDKFSYLPRLVVKLPSVVPPGTSEAVARAKVGRELKAEAVLFGEVFREGGSLKLRAGLLNTADATLMWGATFDLDSADLLALQDEITREVTAKLDLWLIGRESESLDRRQTENPKALTLYMRGRHYLNERKGPEGVQKAAALFKEAIDLDASFTKAYAGLADAYVISNNVAYGTMSAKEAMEVAGWAARKAIESGYSRPEAHTSMGAFKLRYERDWQGAEREFKRAIELDPDYAPAHFWYSSLLAVMKRPDESITQSELGRSLDPYSTAAAMNYGRALYYARRYDKAAEYLDGLLAADPNCTQCQHALAYVQLQQGLPYEAIKTLKKLSSEKPLHAAAALGYAYGKTGQPDEALRILRYLEQSPDPVPPHEKALVYMGMGDMDQAFAALNESCDERFASIAFLTTDPLYDELRPDPRFAELVRRANLAP